MLCCSFILGEYASASPKGEDGETLSIADAEGLKAFAQAVNSGRSFKGQTVRLTADILLNDTTGWRTWDRATTGKKQWTPIGTKEHPFEGEFDGDGHVIAGLFLKAGSETMYQGLFGCVQHAVIKNTSIRYSHILGYNFVGGFAGKASLNTLFLNCSQEGIVEADRNFAGGIAGFTEKFVRIVDCSNTGTVQGHRCVGGMTGYFDSGSIYNCFNRGKVVGKYEHVGGIVGEYSEAYYKSVTKSSGLSELNTLPDDTLANCYNTGVIAARDVAGGIVGYMHLNYIDNTTLKAVFANNYSAGRLATAYPVFTDGLVGAYMYFGSRNQLYVPTISRIERDGGPCYWSEESCKISESDRPRFEANRIKSDSYLDVASGVTAVPKDFSYFKEAQMKEADFLGLLNEWVDKCGTKVFHRWRLDKGNENGGFPVFDTK